MARRSSENAIDWEAVERDYRTGQMSVAAVCESHGVSKSTLLARAKKEGWERDMTEAVKVATKAKLVRETIRQHQAVVRTETRAKVQERKDELVEERIEEAAESLAAGVDIAAAANVQVVMSHRRDLSRLKTLSFKMLGELEQATDNVPELHALQAMVAEELPEALSALNRFVSLANRVGTVEKLTNSFTRIVTLERQAFGLDEDGKNKADTTVEEILRAAQQGA